VDSANSSKHSITLYDDDGSMTPELFNQISGGLQRVGADWMSATAALRAFAYDDPFLIWARYHAKKHDLTEDETEGSMFEYITGKGHEFEQAWFDHEAPEAETCLVDDKDVVNVTGVMRTIELMEKRVPIIKHAALWNAEERVYGAADVIFLRSWMEEKYGNRVLDEANGTGDDYYIVADLKFTRNLGKKAKDAKIYADQVRLYSWMLGMMQQRMPKYGYLITRDSINEPLEVPIGYRLGDELDDGMRKIRDAFVDIKLNGANYLPWRDRVVAPNFANEHDEPWKAAKKCIAEYYLKHRPLEWLPGVGVLAAQSLREAGHSSIDDLLHADLDAIPFEKMKHIGPTKGAYVRAVLHANKHGKPSRIPKDILPDSTNLYFCDFEFANDMNADFSNDWPELRGSPMIFMIGVGWERNGKWQYWQCTAREQSLAGERQMLNEFLGFIDREGILDPSRKAILVHFTGAEVTQSGNAAAKHSMPELARLPWWDLQKSIKSARIVIPGSWDFGLKSLVKSLGEYAPEYRISYPENLSNGANAQILAFEMYDQPEPNQSPHCELIAQYLEIDCKSMWHLLSWMANVAEPGPDVVLGHYTDTENGAIARFARRGHGLRSYSIGWYRCLIATQAS